MGVDRSRFFLCPLERGFSDVCPVERTQRSAPPPPGCWALAGGVLGCGHIGGLLIQVFSLPSGTGLFGCLSSGADTEVRPPATLFLDPGSECFWVGAQRGWATTLDLVAAYDAFGALYGPRSTVHGPPSTVPRHPPLATPHALFTSPLQIYSVY